MATTNPNESLADALTASRNARMALTREYGFMPMSILKITRGRLSKNIFVFQHEHGSMQIRADKISTIDHIKSDAAKRKHLERIARGVVGGTLGIDKKIGGGQTARIQVSIMPPELVEFFCRYYSAPGETYIDPFMGHGVRMQTAVAMGMNYIGFDVCREYCRFIDAVKRKIGRRGITIETHCHDARDMSAVPDNTADFCFTSPPYWNVEYYGDEPEQLGNDAYPAFLESMKTVAAGTLRVMKPGSYCVINTNDFRKGAEFYPYHVDVLNAYRAAGWLCHDMWIVEGLVGGLSRIFAVERHQSKIAPKIHEYAMVFRKPGERPARPIATDGNGTVKIRVSGKCMREPFVPCTPEYVRDICHGRCCATPGGVSVVVQPSEQPGIERHGVRVIDNMIEMLPNKRCPFHSTDGKCSIHGTDQPLGCRGSPFMLNTNGTLIVRNRNRRLNCYGIKNGKRVPGAVAAHVAHRWSLGQLIGDDEAARIGKLADAGVDCITAEIPYDRYRVLVANAKRRSSKWAM